MSGYSVTNSLVSIGGGMRVRVHRYRRDFKVDDDPTFVLVHGIGVSSQYFLRLAEHLLDAGDVIALDLPGFGDTTKPPHPLSIPGFAATVHRIMRFENVTNPVILGHSMGAQVVTELAARDPHWINKLLLLGPPVNALERTSLQVGYRFLQSSVYEPFEVSRFAVGAYLKSGLAWFMQTLPQMVAYPIGIRLADSKARTYLMRGQYDHVAPRAWLEDLRLATTSGTGTDVPIFEVEGGAHSVIVRHASQVADALIQLSKEPPIRPSKSEQMLHKFANEAADPSRQVLSGANVWDELKEHQMPRPAAWAVLPLAVSDYAISIAQAVQTRLMRAGIDKSPQDAMRTSGGPVAVGIPGIVETSEHLHLAGHALHRAGWDVRLVPSLDTMRGPVPLLARRLEQFLDKEDLTQVVIFAHSKGGLLGKAVMAGPQGWRVRAMVSLGTPYSGSSIANLAPRGLGIDDLRTTALELRQQFEDTSVNPRITSIQAKWDQQVPNGSWLPGARVVTAKMYGHNNLLSSRAALRVLVAEMERHKPRVASNP